MQCTCGAKVAVTLSEIARRTTSTEEEGPESQNPETDVAELVQNGLAALRTLRDEIRMDLNLAGKEVRDRWRRLEARLQAAETRARQTRREGAQSLAALIESAKDFRARVLEKTKASSPPR